MDECKGGEEQPSTKRVNGKIQNSDGPKIGNGSEDTELQSKNNKQNIDDTDKMNDEEELLGSVKTIDCPGVRTSARVIQKMKMDLIRPVTPPPPPPPERKEITVTPRTPSQPRAGKIVWSNTERSFFFEAINEYGKDFEAIAQYVNTKMRRKTSLDLCNKTKEHARALYHQQFHKVSKYLRFSDDVKKVVQELYALINYGEMRRKLIFVNEKACMKLKELVYKGSVVIRMKGKNIRIKTPSCKALRRVNQMEELQEEIKVPNRVEVILRPQTNEAWGRVQSLAQNPRIKTVLPLQKRIISLLKTFENRWKRQEMRLHDMAINLANASKSGCEIKLSEDQLAAPKNEPMLCFAPSKTATIHRPLVNLNEFVSCYSICLNAFEEKIGAKVRGETLTTERLATLKENMKLSQKRQRNDSGSEKKSPDGKKSKLDVNVINSKIENNNVRVENVKTNGENLFSNCLSENLNTQENSDKLSESLRIEKDLKTDPLVSMNSSLEPDNGIVNSVGKDSKSNGNNSKRKEKTSKKRELSRKDSNVNMATHPLLNEEMVKSIRNGWTLANVGDLSVGDLYLIFGDDCKLHIEYSWVKVSVKNKKCEESVTPDTETNDKSSNELEVIKNSNLPESLGSKLKILLSLAKLFETEQRKPPCNCGHVCINRVKKKDDLISGSFISNKVFSPKSSEVGLFRQPNLPLKNGISQLDFLRLTSNINRNSMFRYIKGMNGRPFKQVVVQRTLPVQPGISSTYEVVNSDITNIEDIEDIKDMKLIQLNDRLKKECNKNGKALPSETITSEMKVDNSINSKNQQKDGATETKDSTTLNNKTSNASPSVSEDKSIERTEQELRIEKIRAELLDEGLSNLSSISNNPGIQCLMDISLPSPLPAKHHDYIGAPPSPLNLLRETTSSSSDPKWLEDNLNDISFSSFLGQLDTALDIPTTAKSSIENEASLGGTGESSFDYMTLFQQIADSMKNSSE